MPKTDEEIYQEMHQNSTCLYSKTQIEKALADMAKVMANDLSNKNPVFLSVLEGAKPTMAYLADQYPFPMLVNEIKTSRYRNGTEVGEFVWIQKPTMNLKNRTVVVVDDIYDTGGTVHAITQTLYEEFEVSEVKIAVLLDKIVPRTLKNPDYTGLNVPANTWVYGFGMDCYAGYGREHPEVRIAHPLENQTQLKTEREDWLSFLANATKEDRASCTPESTTQPYGRCCTLS